MFDSNIQNDPLELELIEVNPNNINYLQRTVSEIRVFDVNKYEPIRVMCADGQLVSYDNRRLISVQNAQLDKLKVDLVKEYRSRRNCTLIQVLKKNLLYVKDKI